MSRGREVQVSRAACAGRSDGHQRGDRQWDDHLWGVRHLACRQRACQPDDPAGGPQRTCLQDGHSAVDRQKICRPGDPVDGLLLGARGRAPGDHQTACPGADHGPADHRRNAAGDPQNRVPGAHRVQACRRRGAADDRRSRAWADLRNGPPGVGHGWACRQMDAWDGPQSHASDDLRNGLPDADRGLACRQSRAAGDRQRTCGPRDVLPDQDAHREPDGRLTCQSCGQAGHHDPGAGGRDPWAHRPPVRDHPHRSGRGGDAPWAVLRRA